MNYMIPNAPETTGKYLVLFDKAADLETAIQSLGDLAGIHSVAKASDFKGGALNGRI